MREVQIGWPPEAARPTWYADSLAPRADSLIRGLVPLLAALSAASGGVHLAVVQEHFSEYRLFSIFFAVLAVAQLAWACVAPLKSRGSLYALAAIGNLLVILLWIWSRTAGLPIGPEPNHPEPVGFADATCSAMEGLLVVGSLVMLIARRTLRPAFTD